jgi:protein-L-isoaspartate(D-aspartate) O-methyltransferase
MVDYERLRKGMVDNQLRTVNITDRRLLGVMGQVPREIFVPPARAALAYIDDSHELGHGRLMPAAAPFARLVQLAEIDAADAVLDIGAATGYSTAVLAHLAHEVVGIESEPGLADAARANLASIGVSNAEIITGAFDTVSPGAKHFDVIVLEGAVESVPSSLFELLADGGRLVASIRRGPAAVAHVFVKSGSAVNSRAEFNSSLPPLAQPARAEEFVF